MFGVSPSATSDPNQPNGPIDDIIVVTVGDDSPAEQAGIVPSTEIVSVNELSVTERLAEIQDWYVGTFSTDEKRLANGSQIQLRFPIGNEVTLGYRLPDATIAISLVGRRLSIRALAQLLTASLGVRTMRRS
jgi:C-terminal processing protease CtpA/Prc